MSKRDQPTVRVQVYFENPKIEAALRREARVAKVSVSRAAEAAIQRGLLKRPAADPEDRLLSLDRALRDHMRSQQRDMTIVQELVVGLARVMFTRVPKTTLDEDTLHRAAVEADVHHLLDAVAATITGGGSVPPDVPVVEAWRPANRRPEAAETRAPSASAELRSFQPAG
jgi:hypothetical protein